MRINIQKKLLYFSLFILLGNIAVGYGLYRSKEKLVTSERWVYHTRQVIFEAANIGSLSKDMEVASLTYIFTKDAALRSPIAETEAKMVEDVQHLKKLTQDNPVQQHLADSLEVYIRKRHSCLFSLTAQNEKFTSGSNMAYISGIDKLSSHTHILALTDRIRWNENKLLRVRSEINAHNDLVSNIFLASVFILMAFATILVLIISSKNLLHGEQKALRAAELLVANGELLHQNKEKEKRAAELVIANEELEFQNIEKEKRAAELQIANQDLYYQNKEKVKRAAELIEANEELLTLNREKGKWAAELIIANEKLQFQNVEKGKRAEELAVANIELLYQNTEKEQRAAELAIANKELLYQNDEKESRAAELIVANEELHFQSEEKGKRAAELVIANEELHYQNEEKGKRAAELVVANEELHYQNDEKEKRAAELAIANKELIYQNGEKERKAGELIIANEELHYQNEEKGKRAAELVIANEELHYQNDEKERKAAELIIANEELLYQNEEKEKRAAELVIANKKLHFESIEKGKRAIELSRVNHLYAFLSQVNKDIVRVKDRTTLFRNACRIATDFGKFEMAWIGLFDQDEIQLVEQSGVPNEIDLKLKHAPFKVHGPQSQILETGDNYICHDIMHTPELATWYPFSEQYNVRSFMILPIKIYGKVIGSFNLYSSEPNFSDPGEIILLNEIAGDICFAIDTLENEKTHRESEVLLVENENRFRALIEKSTDMKTLLSPDRKLIYGSPSVYEVLGYTMAAFLMLSPDELIHPDDALAAKESTRSMLRTPGTSIFIRQRLRHQDGSWIWCEGSVTNMLHEPGVHALVSNFRDISDKKRIEQQLEFDRNNLDALINTTHDMMWSVDKEFKLITANKPFDDMVTMMSGKKIEKGESVLMSGFSAEQITKYNGYYERSFTGESFSEIEYNLVPEEFWTENFYSPIRKGDEIIGAACHSHDITAMKKAQKTLQESEKSLKESQSVAQLGHWQLDFATGVSTWSEEHCKIYGVSPLDTQQTYATWLSFIHPDDLELVKKTNQDMREKATKTDLDYRIITRAGILKYINARYKLEYDEGGQPSGLYGIAHDVTEMREKEQQLQESEAFNYAVINSLSSRIAVIDSMGKIVAVNESWKNIAAAPGDISQLNTGIGSNYLDSCLEAATSGDDSAIDILQGITKVIQRQSPVFYIEYPVYSSPVQQWLSMRVLKLEQEEPMVVISLQDISDRKLAEIERQRITGDLMQRNNDLEQFSYIVSHNLRAPVANIIGASNALDEPTLSVSDSNELRYAISASVKRLDGVLTDLNHILQVKAAINETREKVVFSLLVTDIKLSIQNLIKSDGVTIDYDFAAIDEWLTLKPYLYSIFYNLIVNSVKYRRPDVPCLINIKSMLVNNKLTLVFTDNGLGIDLEKKGRQLFGLYKRFHTNIEGKGMGLFMVKTQVETLGGEIRIESTPGEGARFIIEFGL